MTVNHFIHIVPKLVKYNIKIIFAGKFIWFILAALVFLLFVMFQSAWNKDTDISEKLIYGLLLFPSMLLIFYPSVFGIQNDEDARILELLFGIPNYKYKVWAVRLLIIYIAIFFILILFSYLTVILLYPINPVLMSFQLMFPILFYGNLAFMFSTITRSGNGTAVIMIVITIALIFLQNMQGDNYWNIILNPFAIPRNMLPVIWESIILKNRIFLLVGSIIWMMTGLMNLQKREKFLG
ncbi:MAG: hypothetical protein LBC68_08745 [Prevotellaceae bacterium]|jgi:hypothetical protein|nr:hypothetical protein [Prevotellaceae bacterium]